jgi:hypothetical protein
MTRASFPYAYKSLLYRERRHWDADLKVDYDIRVKESADPDKRRNPMRMRAIKLAKAALDKMGVHVKRALVLRTKKGLHLRVWLSKPLRPWTTLRLHEILGDDPVRQRFNLARVRRREPGWNVLWNEKWRNGRLVMQEALDERETARAAKVLEAQA